MLLDFDEDITITVTTPGLTSDQRGMSSGDPTGLVRKIPGRISGVTSSQKAMWATLGFEADAELFCLDGGLQNNWLVTDDVGVVYRITGRARRYAKGNIVDYWRYPIADTSLQ